MRRIFQTRPMCHRATAVVLIAASYKVIRILEHRSSSGRQLTIAITIRVSSRPQALTMRNRVYIRRAVVIRANVNEVQMIASYVVIDVMSGTGMGGGRGSILAKLLLFHGPRWKSCKCQSAILLLFGERRDDIITGYLYQKHG